MSSTYLRLPLTGSGSTPAPFLQTKSFAVDDSDDSKVVLERTYGNKFDFSGAFTIIVPLKANWVTGPTTNYILDLKNTFYFQFDQTGDRFTTRLFDATTNESVNTTSFTPVNDGDWVWLGMTYDGAGGYQFIVQGDLYASSGSKILQDNSEIFRFGERFGYTVTQDMSMGNILIINKVASAAEVTSYYGAGIAVDAYEVFDTSEIVHYYKADTFVDQTTVPDSGGVAATMRGALAEKGLLTTTDVPS